MATFHAIEAFDFRKLSDLTVLLDSSTTYVNSLPFAFSATNGPTYLIFNGVSITEQGGKPVDGTINTLTANLSGLTYDYAFASLGADLSDFLDALAGGNQAGLAYLLRGHDEVKGSRENDVLSGFAGNDLMTGGKGFDRIDGGTGNDTANYASAKKTVSVMLDGSAYATVKVGNKVEDKIKNIENVTGGNAGDRLSGDANNNQLFGNAGDDALKGKGGFDILYGHGGNDRLVGGTGDDQLTGGIGKDILIGGAGADLFVFDVALTNANADTIKDFQVGIDTIVISRSVLDKFNLGAVDPSKFVIGTPPDDDECLIYNAGNGKLFYDGNGTDPGARGLIAKLDKGLNLTADDFYIVA